MLSLRLLDRNQLRKITINGSKSLLNTRTDGSKIEPIIADIENYNKILMDKSSEYYRKEFYRKNNKLFNELSFWLMKVSKTKQPINELLNEQELNVLCEKIAQSVGGIRDNRLTNLLHSFLAMGLDPNTRVVSYLENEILWRSRNFPLNILLKCLSYHIRYQETDQQKQVVNELILRIPTKLDEAKDDEDVLLMLRLSKCFTEECIEHIENTALEMIVQNNEQFKVDSLCYLLVLLSQLNRRTKPLIRAAINKFNDLKVEEMQCSPNNLINMISALNSLNFPDYNLLQKSCHLLCNMKFLDKVSSSAKRDLLVAVNQLNWCYPRLMDTFIEKMTDKPDSFSPQDLFVFVITSARLYYRTPFIHEILSSYIIPNVKQKDMDNKSWLLYVWSLTILGSVPFEHISSVLNNKFCDELLNNSQIHESVINKLKLLNIKAFAEIEMKKDMKCPNKLKTKFQMPEKQKELKKFQNLIIESLNSFMPKDKYMSTHITTPLGFNIDAEFIVDSYNKPIPIAEYGIFGADLNMETKSLPPGFKRVAVMVYGYNDTLLDNSQLIGVNEFAIRLLKELNYSIVVINQNKIPITMSTVKKIQHLQKLISNCV